MRPGTSGKCCAAEKDFWHADLRRSFEPETKNISKIEEVALPVAVNLAGLPGDTYFLELRDPLRREVALNVTLPGSLNAFSHGAAGLIGNLANIMPKTVRRYVDLYECRDFDAIGQVYADLERFRRYIEQPERGTGLRQAKMAMKILKLPGGEGGMREPYLMPPG